MKARDTYRDHQRPAHISVKEYMEFTVYSSRDRKNLTCKTNRDRKRKRQHTETAIETIKKPNSKQAP